VKSFERIVSVTLVFLLAVVVPAHATPGELTLPLAGAQVMFQVFSNPGGGIPTSVPPLDLRNVRSTDPVISATVGGMQVKYFEVAQAIEDAIEDAAPDQGKKFDLIGQQGDHDYCYLVYGINPEVTFLGQPETLNVVENSPGHLTASFDTIVQVAINVQANVFNIPVIGNQHVESDILIWLQVHAALDDVGVWPPNTNDLFVSGDPPTLNPNHVELTLQQVGGNVELDGLQGPIALSGFLISLGGILAAPLSFGLSLPLAFLGPLLAIGAPAIEEMLETIMNAQLSMAIEGGISELDMQIRDVLAEAGNEINAANAISNRAPTLFPAANVFNTWMNGWFGGSFATDTRIDDEFVAVGLTIKRNPGASTGPNAVGTRIRFPKYKCEYEQGDLIEENLSCDGKHLWKVYIYEMVPKLVPVNADLVGKSCATLFSPDVYSRSYLGSDWDPPQAEPDWQTLAPAVTGTTVQQATSGAQTYYACNMTLGSLPSNVILDFGAKGGSGLAQRIVPVRNGSRLPDELVVDPQPYLGRVHMLVRPTGRAPLVVLDEEGDPVLSASVIGDVGPQPGTLAQDCPSYALAMDGYYAGVCSNPGSYESPCGDCY
jgi:hypothetical protein